MSKVKKTKKLTEYLKYTFSTDESVDNAKQLARKNQQVAELELKKKQLMSDIKSEQEDAAASVARLARWVNDGYDFRMIECEVQFHVPKEGRKTVIRLDTGEVVDERKMDSGELQDVLPLEESPKNEPDAKK